MLSPAEHAFSSRPEHARHPMSETVCETYLAANSFARAVDELAACCLDPISSAAMREGGENEETLESGDWADLPRELLAGILELLVRNYGVASLAAVAEVCVAWRNSLEALLGDLSTFIEFPPPVLDGVPDVTGMESHFLFMGLNLKYPGSYPCVVTTSNEWCTHLPCRLKACEYGHLPRGFGWLSRFACMMAREPRL